MNEKWAVLSWSVSIAEIDAQHLAQAEHQGQATKPEPAVLRTFFRRNFRLNLDVKN
jgi:hypothetical protein